MLLYHISVKGHVSWDGFLSILEWYFLTLLCCCPFRPTPGKPLELWNLLPLRRLDFTNSRDSFSKLSRSATTTLCEQTHAYSKHLQLHFNVFFSDLIILLLFLTCNKISFIVFVNIKCLILRNSTRHNNQSQINFRKSHQIYWNLDELLKSYNAKYTWGSFWPPGSFGSTGKNNDNWKLLVFFVFTNVFSLELETRLYYLSMTIKTDTSTAKISFSRIKTKKFDNFSNFQNVLTQPLGGKLSSRQFFSAFFYEKITRYAFNPISKVWKFN